MKTARSVATVGTVSVNGTDQIAIAVVRYQVTIWDMSGSWKVGVGTGRKRGGQRMIPKTAFIALALVMVSAWVFGGFCDRLLIKWFDGLKTPTEDTEKHTCDNCKYGRTRPQEEPCCECLQDDDIDRWEAIE